MKKIKELTIKEEQEIQFEILKQFDEMCKKENIQYFIAYGTLLGAIREHGFIEWDDDIDLWMRRDQIRKLKSTFYSYFDKNQYFFQDCKTDSYSVSPEMVRICVNNTYKWCDGAECEKFHTGIYFDIFPLDNGIEYKNDIQRIHSFVKAHSKLYSSLKCDNPKGVKKKIKNFINHFIPRKLKIKRVLNILAKYDCAEPSDKLIAFPASYAGINRCYFDSCYFENVEYHEFEGLSFPCPNKSNELLAYMYGDDYMTPTKTKPSIEKAYILEKDENI